jgi:hypothetical protein
MMVNGIILCAVTPVPTSADHFPSPTSFYEFDPVANSFTQVNGPTGFSYNSATYIMRMLDLPDGTVLFSASDSQLYVYQPDGSPLTSGKPTINSISGNLDGSFHLTGLLLNGITEGASYGDDAQMDSNYPLIRLTNSNNGVVYYARTYNWSSTSVMTGSRVVTTEFLPPAGLPLADYSLVAVANGNSSDPVPFMFSTSAPVITVPPQNQSLTEGTSVTFSVAAAGAPLNYFWRRNNVNIPGANSPTYTANNIQLANSGDQFSCLVSNVNGTTLSSSAFLTVLPGQPPAITSQPASLTVSVGSSASFSITATSTAPVTYFWKRNDVLIAGAASSSYTTNNVQLSDSGAQFSCLASNVFGTRQSSNALLIVTPPSLVQNGGFEAGSFAGWAQSGNTGASAYTLVSTSSAYVHSGSYGVQSGPSGSLFYLTQTLATTPGQNYLLSFWLGNPSAGTPNQFVASWNGATVINQLNLGALDWTNEQFIVTATSGSTAIQFGFRNDPSYFGFDDVSVTPVSSPVFQSLNITTNTVRLTWSSMGGVGYQLQYKTNLTQASWVNLGNPIRSTGSSVTATDAPGADPQRFYRLIMQP